MWGLGLRLGRLPVLWRGLVGAVLDVEAGVGDAEALDGAVVEEVLGDDLVDVFEVDVAVPDGFGIDDDDRAMLALVEAAGLVGADVVLEAGFLDGVLEGWLELLTAAGEATWAHGGFVALVGADEDVVVEFRQWLCSLFPMADACRGLCDALLFLRQ
jgi:hypothetical protein